MIAKTVNYVRKVEFFSITKTAKFKEIDVPIFLLSMTIWGKVESHQQIMVFSRKLVNFENGRAFCSEMLCPSHITQIIIFMIPDIGSLTYH